MSRRALSAVAVGALLAGAAAPAPPEPAPPRALTQYVHTAWLQRDGLPVSSVTDLAETPDGDLWLATPEGLVRFDGRRFDRFHAGNTTGLDNRVVETLAVDPRSGALRVGGLDGLFTFLGDRFEPLLAADGAALARVDRLASGPDGTLWVSHRDGLARFRDGRLEPALLPDGSPAPHADGLLAEPDGTLWIASGELLRASAGEVTRFGEAQGLPAPASAVARFRGELWVGTRGGGLFRLAGERFEPLAGSDGTSTLRLLATDDALWIAGLGRGLMRWDGARLETLGSREGLGSDDVFTVLADRDGQIWFGAQGGGLNRLHAGDFVTAGPPEGLPHPNVAAVYEDRGGRLWVGSSGGGLVASAGDGWRRYGPDDGLASQAIMTLGEDAAGALWVGTGDAGAFRLDANGRFRHLEGGEAAVPRTVFAVAAAPDGVWLGGGGGAVWSDGASVRPLFTPPAGRPWMTTTFVPQGEELWIGSIRTGLARLAAGEVTTVGAGEGLEAESALALHLDSSAALWIGTLGGGLARRAPDGAIAALRARDGLCEDVVYSILEDELGFLWLGGNRGVCRVARAALEARLAGGAAPLEPRLFGVEDGVRAGETSGGPNRSAFRGADGRLHFATPAGVATVDPAHLLPAPRPPRARVEALVCDGAAIALAGGRAATELPPAARGCELRVHAAVLGRSEPVRVEVRIDGDEADWIDVTESRAVSFGGLGPGEHEVVVRARVVGAGGAAGETAGLAFRVAPRLVETPAFRLAALALLVAFAWTFYRLRTRALVERRRQLEQEVAARTAELERASAALAESNATLERRVEEGIASLRRAERLAAYGELVASVAHEVRQPVFGLQAAAYVLGQRLGGETELVGQLRTIELETRRIGTLMEDLLEFARPAELRTAPAEVAALLAEAVEVDRAEQGEAGPAVASSQTGAPASFELDRARIVQVLVNLLGNARKHARGATRIALAAAASPRFAGGLRLTVEDDGPGIASGVRESLFEPFVTSGAGSGLGLAIVRRVVEQHGGEVAAEAAEPRGARIVLDLPPRS